MPSTAMELRRREDATSSVACAPASPQGEANGRGRKQPRRKNPPPEWPRQKAAPARKSLLHSIPRRLFAQIWPRMLQTLRPTQGMSLTQNSIRTSRSTARAGTRRKTGIPLQKGGITALKNKIFKPGPTRCGKSIFCPEIPWRKICPSQYDDKLLYFSIKS